MNVEFRNYLTLNTVPSKMSKVELLCSVLTWVLVLGFVAIAFLIFSEKVAYVLVNNSSNMQTRVFTLYIPIIIWIVVFSSAVTVSFYIDIKQKIINMASILWLVFLIFVVSRIIEKL